MADIIAYPGNSALSKEVRDKILSTFRHSLNLYRSGKAVDSAVGCEFILKMDPRFGPARRLLEKAHNPSSEIDLAEFDAFASDEAPAPPSTGGEPPDKLLISAIEAYAERQFDRAIENANKVLAALPGNNDAREILEKAKRKRDLQPHVENFRQRALFALESGQEEEARLNFERMQNLDPEHPEVERLAARFEGTTAPPEPAALPAIDPDEPDFRFDVSDRQIPPVEPYRPPAGAAATDVGASPPPAGMEGLDLGPLSESSALSEWGPVLETSPSPNFAQPPPASGPQPNFADLWGPPEAAAPAGESSAPASPGSVEIARLLREGDDLSARDPQAAIETWSRIFLLDLGNADATARIENARLKLAETNRRVADALKTGRSLYDGGQLKEAREKFLEVLAIDENEPMARSFLQRIEGDMSRPQVSYDLSLTSPRGDVLDEDEVSPRENSPASFPAARQDREAAPAARRRPWIPVVAAGALLLAIGAGVYVLLRPGRPIPPAEAEKPVPRRRSEVPPMPAPPAPAPAAGTGPISLPASPPAGADAKRAEAEGALAEHRYIAALTAFNLAAPAYPNDPGFRQEMGQAAERVGEISPAVKLYNDGDYETALPILWRLHQADRQNQDVRSYLVRAYYDLGVINLQNNLFDKASRSFNDALGVDPEDALAKRQKAFADRYVKRPPDLLARIYVKYLRPRP
ncbi:MAG: hypothetical protein ACRD16_05800 [Thermoanaerobaculia bacterium]